MAEAARHTVLKRKVTAGRDSAPAGRLVLPAKALSSALTKAADTAMGLLVTVESCSERIASLSDLLERLPENGLLAVLEGPAEGQGLMAFDGGFLSSVIEKQMTGAVGSAPASCRRATRTDAALAADLIDSALQGFEATLAGREESRWASGFGYASHVEDLRPLGLLLEEIDYRIFGLELDLEAGTRTGHALLALPAVGRGAVLTDDAASDPDSDESDPGWEDGLEEQVLQGEVRLDAVLHRFHLPISAISDFKIGDELPIPSVAIDNVKLTGAERIPLGRCRLGRSQDNRAVRLGAEAALDSAQMHPGSGLARRANGAGLAPDTVAPFTELPDEGNAMLTELSPLPSSDFPDPMDASMATPMAMAPFGGEEDMPETG